LAAIVFAIAFATVPSGPFAARPTATDFHQHLGLQLWSLRAQMARNVGLALDRAKAFGFTEVEVAGTGTTPAAQLSDALRVRELVPVGGHFGYAQLKSDLPGVIRDARALGLQYVVCPILPFKTEAFDEAAAERVAAEFNSWGASLRAAGIRFAYHTHGIEFQPTAAGAGETSFDVLVRETQPDLVSFEMDVFWVVHAGQNPVRLLKKYPDRWALLHLKDIRLGSDTGLTAPPAGPADNVPVGTGQIDWPSVLAAAQRIGVKYYFIEDETADPLRNIALSLSYLRGLKP
jgi:sugar phosphate isomerase/epimerase